MKEDCLKNFEDLGLSLLLLSALASQGSVNPTGLQQVTIPLILSGGDLVGFAQTGTGETTAFALPALQRLTEGFGATQKTSSAIRGLVLAPTRELAAQIGPSFMTHCKNLNQRIAVVHDGVSHLPQVRAIQRGIDLLVVTPGRLLDLMQQRQVDISKTEVLIIDEAD